MVFATNSVASAPVAVADVVVVAVAAAGAAATPSVDVGKFRVVASEPVGLMEAMIFVREA